MLLFNYCNSSQFAKLTSLQVVKDYLNNIPSINAGGCGISAYSMYKFLEKKNQLQKDTHIIYLWNSNWCGSDVIENKNFLENQTGNCDSCAHVIMYHNGEYHDSSGSSKHIDGLSFYERFKWDDHIELPIPQHLTDIFMVKSLNEGDWNWKFDRAKYLPQIEKFLGFKLGINIK